MGSGENVDSLACVAIGGGGTFTGIPDGKYVDAVTGDTKTVSGGSLTVSGGGLRVYVCCAGGFKGISGAIGGTSSFM
jgi:hypothetical protein